MKLSAYEAAAWSRAQPVFTSGAVALDLVLGGGYRAGTLTMLYGRSNSGKSQLAMQAALLAAKAGAHALYVDTEGAFRPERMEQMAEARGWRAEELIRRVVYVRCASAAEQVEAVRMAGRSAETKRAGLVVVDTLARNFTLDLPGEQNMPGRQGALDAHLSAMARDAFLGRRAYLLTDRVTFGREGEEVPIGGRTVTQLTHAAVHLERAGETVGATARSGAGCRLRIGPDGVSGDDRGAGWP